MRICVQVQEGHKPRKREHVMYLGCSLEPLVVKDLFDLIEDLPANAKLTNSPKAFENVLEERAAKMFRSKRYEETDRKRSGNPDKTITLIAHRVRGQKTLNINYKVNIEVDF